MTELVKEYIKNQKAAAKLDQTPNQPTLKQAFPFPEQD
jgi:hypothetical protein